MIEEMDREHVVWVLLEDVGADWRDDLRFRNTHRLMWEHIVHEFDVIPTEGLPPSYVLFRRKSAGPLESPE